MYLDSLINNCCMCMHLRCMCSGLCLPGCMLQYLYWVLMLALAASATGRCGVCWVGGAFRRPKYWVLSCPGRLAGYGEHIAIGSSLAAAMVRASLHLAWCYIAQAVNKVVEHKYVQGCVAILPASMCPQPALSTCTWCGGMASFSLGVGGLPSPSQTHPLLTHQHGC